MYLDLHFGVIGIIITPAVPCTSMECMLFKVPFLYLLRISRAQYLYPFTTSYRAALKVLVEMPSGFKNREILHHHTHKMAYGPFTA